MSPEAKPAPKPKEKKAPKVSVVVKKDWLGNVPCQDNGGSTGWHTNRGHQHPNTGS